MKVIIIQESRFCDLLDQLKLAKFEGDISNSAEKLGVTPSQYKQLLADVHQRFHYVVVCWSQEEGARCIR